MKNPFRLNPSSFRLGFAAVLGLSLAAVSPSAFAQTYDWNQTDTPNNWSNATNWNTTVPPAGGPSGASIVVNINTNIAATSTINLALTGDGFTAAKTVGILSIGDTDGTHASTLAAGTGGGSLIMDNGGSNAQINHISTGLGTDTISAPIFLNGSLDTSNAATLAMLINGNVSSNTAGLKTITNVGGGTGFFTFQTGVIGDGSGQVAVNQNSATSTLNLRGANTYTGGTTITAGNLIVNPTVADSVGGTAVGLTGNITFAGGSLEYGNDSIANGGTVGDYSTRFKSTGGNAILLDISGEFVTLGGGIDNTNVNGLNMTATPAVGGMTLNGTNSHSGGTIWSGGSAASLLNIGSVTALGTGTFDIGRGTIDNTSGSDMTLTNTVHMRSDINFAGSDNLEFTSDGTLGNSTGIGAAGSSQDFNIGANTLTVNGVLTDSGGTTSFNKLGAGTLVLTGANTFTGGVGATGIANGIVSVSSIGNSTTAGGLGQSTSLIAMGANTTVGQLTYTGAGETVVSQRAIKLVSGVGGATLDQSGTGLLKFTGNTTNPGLAATDQRKTLTLQGSTTGTGEYSGKLIDALAGNVGQTALSVVKQGTGTWTLSAANTYSGTTTVSAGTLLISNATGSGTGTGSVAVNAGTLGGTGFINPGNANGVTVASGAFIAPGASIGNLTIGMGNTTGKVDFTAGGDFKFELGAANANIGSIANSTSDLLLITGASTGDVLFGGGNNIDLLGTATAEGYYKLFDTDLNATTWTGLTLGAAVTGGNLIDTGLTASNFGGGFGGNLILADGSSGTSVGDIYLQIVPEPSTVILTGIGLAVALFGFRRRFGARA